MHIHVRNGFNSVGVQQPYLLAISLLVSYRNSTNLSPKDFKKKKFIWKQIMRITIALGKGQSYTLRFVSLFLKFV